MPRHTATISGVQMHMTDKRVLVLGGGLTGLSAGYVLSRKGVPVEVFEGGSEVGGLCRTIASDGFRFDLGGHRFHTKDREVDALIRGLMEGELITVGRSSKIYLRDRFFDYPLRPFNAMFGLGIRTTAGIIADYGIERLKRYFVPSPSVSLEDWVVSHFGRTMFNIYFREYSEKVWGIDCRRISADWVAQRIRGLSLGTALKNAFFRFSGSDIPTLADSFVYPRLGIGRIADRLTGEIEQNGLVHTGARVEQVSHSGSRIDRIIVRSGGKSLAYEGDEFISSIPISHLVRMMRPAPPDHILEAAGMLKYRDIVIVALMLDRERVTDQTWIYVPEKKIPFGRIHEPKNWSAQMAPEDKTLLVMEFFSFQGDAVWNEQDDRLTDITVENLERLGFIRKSDVLGSVIVRAPKAYPLFEIGYARVCDELYAYLDGFTNLHAAGRLGKFRYYNMDHAIRSGMDAAMKVIERITSAGGRDNGEFIPTGDHACDLHS